jgi:hypothetical protein
MHLIDRLAALLVRLDRRRLGIFPEGWGDAEVLEAATTLPRCDDPISGIEILWGRKEEHRGMRITRGSFTSSARIDLPLETRAVPVEVVEPPAGSDRIVVLMPAWNDHGFETRRAMAALLAERGLASAMFDIPFYGARRVVSSRDQAIRTVAAFMLMGIGAVDEARSLLAALAADRAVGVSGYSMGGNVAALVSASIPFPAATSVHAASHSPGPVYLDGILERAIDWQALGGESAREELRRRLSAVSVLDEPVLPHHRTATLVAASRDGFVPPSATEALHRHWEGSSLDWVDAGHATLLKRHAPHLADAVVESFERTRF